MNPDYEALLGELETLAKAMPKPGEDGDATIAAAAGEPAAAEAEAAAKKEGEKPAEPAAEPEGGAPMAKSFEVEVGGEKRDAIEVGDLIKSLNEHSDARTAALVAPLVTLVKSLTEQVASLRTTAAPRRSVLAIADKPAGGSMAKSEPPGLTSAEFMAKSNTAFDAGKISGVELTTIDVSLRKGEAIDASLIQRVVG